MSTIDKRLSKLELERADKNGCTVVYREESDLSTYYAGHPWADGVLVLSEADVAELEKDHEVIVVTYVHDWRGGS